MRTVAYFAALSLVTAIMANAQSEGLDFIRPLPPLDESESDSVEVAIPLRPDPIREFARALTTSLRTSNWSQLEGLVSKESGTPEARSREIARLARLLGDAGGKHVSLVLKDLERRPVAAKSAWQRQMSRWTTLEASALCFVRVEGGRQVILTLRRSGGALEIVPADLLAEIE